jgi:hypothetical protein
MRLFLFLFLFLSVVWAEPDQYVEIHYCSEKENVEQCLDYIPNTTSGRHCAWCLEKRQCAFFEPCTPNELYVTYAGEDQVSCDSSAILPSTVTCDEWKHSQFMDQVFYGVMLGFVLLCCLFFCCRDLCRSQSVTSV